MNPTRCRDCGQPAITRVDDCGIEVAIDPTPLSAAGECHAVIAGRTTWQLVPASRRHPAETWRRMRVYIGAATQPGGTLHCAHVCGQPVPAAWAAPVPDHIVITHQPDHDEEPTW